MNQYAAPIKHKSTSAKLVDSAQVYGQEKIEKHAPASFGLAIFAGAFIAIAFVFYVTVTTGSGAMPWGITRLIGGLVFSLGLMLVVVCGGELFTSTVLSSVGWAQGKYSTASMLRCWGRVYLGNMLGAGLMVALVLAAGMDKLNHGMWGLNVLNIATHKVHHSFIEALSLGLLCNLLVCLGIWMSFSSKDSAGKSMLLILPVAMFISSGFEHSVANMFMVPLGILIKSTSALSAQELAAYSDLTWSAFFSKNLFPVTLGNILGGALCVGLGHLAIERSAAKHYANKVTLLPPATEMTQEDLGMYNKLNKTIVSQLMNPHPFTLAPELSLQDALGQLLAQGLRGAPVIDEEHNFIGYISEQDLLRSWWGEDFKEAYNAPISSLMRAKPVVIKPRQRLTDVLESMVVDRNTLYPVNPSGYLMHASATEFSERLREAASNTPSDLPVVEQGKLVGVISRRQFVELLCANVAINNSPDVEHHNAA